MDESQNNYTEERSQTKRIHTVCIYNIKSRTYKLIYSDKQQINGYLGLGRVSTERRSEEYYQGQGETFGGGGCIYYFDCVMISWVYTSIKNIKLYILNMYSLFFVLYVKLYHIDVFKIGLGSQSTPPPAFMVYLPFWDLCSSRSTLHEQTSSFYLPWSVFRPVYSSQVSPAVSLCSLPPPGRLPREVLPHLLPPKVQVRPLPQTRTPEGQPESCGRWPGAQSTQSSHLLGPHSLPSPLSQSLSADTE